jgi:hypothetical protein
VYSYGNEIYSKQQKGKDTSMIHHLALAAPVVLALLGVPNLAHALDGYGGDRGYGYPHWGWNGYGFSSLVVSKILLIDNSHFICLSAINIPLHLCRSIL